jgi:serine/threonine-protein kinase
MSHRSNPPGAFEPGARVGPYEIIAPLGAGGMGEVFRARDTRLGREVAIKVLPRLLAANPERLSRFEQEARAASALNHPNILTVHDVGTHQDQPYLVTELLTGQTLRQALAGAPLAVQTVLAWTRQVAAGLAAAHARGIVHRDLKPENLFLTDDGRLKILDFGIAKLRPEVAGGGAGVATEAGVVLGTVGYMSPEQASGEQVDHRTDFFSLGAVLYELLTGRAAFPGNSLAALAGILREEPPRVSNIRRGVSPDLDSLVSRCLAKRPEDRFQSADEVRAAVASLEGIPGRRAARARRAAIGLAVAGLAIIAILARRERRDSRSGGSLAGYAIAVFPFLDRRGDTSEAYLADGLTDGLVVDLSQIGALRVIAIQDTTRPLAELRKVHGVQAAVRGWFQHSKDSIQIEARVIDTERGGVLWKDAFAIALGDLPRRQGSMAVAIAGALRATLRPLERRRLTTAQEVDRAAYEAWLRGRFALEQGDMEPARRQFERAVELAPAWAPPHVGLANYWTSLSFFTDLPPASVLPHARDEASRALALDSSLAEAHAVQGYLRAYYEWDWRSAEASYRRALALQPSNALAHFSYSRFLASRNRLDEALAQIRQAARFDPLSLELKANEALLHYFAGRWTEAEAGLNETRRVDSAYSMAGWGLALVYEQQGRLPEAIALLEKVAGRNLNRLASLGHAYGLAGQTKRARAILDTLTSRAQSGYVPAYWFAVVHAGLGDTATTLRWLERAFQERSTVLAYLRIDPRIGLVRAQPGYAKLVRQLSGE